MCFSSKRKIFQLADSTVDIYLKLLFYKQHFVNIRTSQKMFIDRKSQGYKQKKHRRKAYKCSSFKEEEKEEIMGIYLDILSFIPALVSENCILTLHLSILQYITLNMFKVLEIIMCAFLRFSLLAFKGSLYSFMWWQHQLLEVFGIVTIFILI